MMISSRTSSPDHTDHLRNGGEAAHAALRFQRLTEKDKKSPERKPSAIYNLFNGPNAGWGSLFVSCFIWATVSTYDFYFS
jgi:hypothetical protein